MAEAKSNLRPDVTSIPLGEPRSNSASSRAVAGYLAALAMTAVATVVAVSVSLGVTIPNLSLIFVVPVVIAGVGFGLGPSLLSAMLGALAYNFFLTEPRYSLAVQAPANIWAIGLLFVVGLIVSGVAYTSGRRATDAARLTRQLVALQDYGRDVVAEDDAEAMVSRTCEALAEVFQVPAVVMLATAGNVVAVQKVVGDVELQEAERGAALSSLATDTFMPAGIYPAVTSRFDFWPVATTMGQRAVIGLAFDPGERPSRPETLVDIVGSVLALALDRRHVPADRRPGSAR